MRPSPCRLPDGSKGAPHLRDIFYRMGFNDQEIVALSGAHALGRLVPGSLHVSCARDSLAVQLIGPIAAPCKTSWLMRSCDGADATQIAPAGSTLGEW